MSDLHTQFTAAADAAKQLRRRPDNASMLKLYALYKQATNGDVASARPGMLDMVGQAKFDAWAAVKGTTREVAMQSYIDLVESLKNA